MYDEGNKTISCFICVILIAWYGPKLGSVLCPNFALCAMFSVRDGVWQRDQNIARSCHADNKHRTESQANDQTGPDPNLTHPLVSNVVFDNNSLNKPTTGIPILIN